MIYDIFIYHIISYTYHILYIQYVNTYTEVVEITQAQCFFWMRAAPEGGDWASLQCSFADPGEKHKKSLQDELLAQL